MKPDPTVYLSELSRLLATDVSPRLPAGWDQAIVARQGMLLQAVAEEFDRAAQRRVEENAALRQLFLSALPLVTDPDLSDSLKAAARSTDSDLRVSRLDAGNQTLRSLLVTLHAHVETLDGLEARELDASIWRELSLSTVRRQLSIGRF